MTRNTLSMMWKTWKLKKVHFHLVRLILYAALVTNSAVEVTTLRLAADCYFFVITPPHCSNTRSYCTLFPQSPILFNRATQYLLLERPSWLLAYTHTLPTMPAWQFSKKNPLYFLEFGGRTSFFSVFWGHNLTYPPVISSVNSDWILFRQVIIITNTCQAAILHHITFSVQFSGSNTVLLCGFLEVWF